MILKASVQPKTLPWKIKQSDRSSCVVSERNVEMSPSVTKSDPFNRKKKKHIEVGCDWQHFVLSNA